MNNLFAFLEGIITFISPCLLPMLPIYISYFGADVVLSDGTVRSRTSGELRINALGFILGFSIVFITMGAFASIIGVFLRTHFFYVSLISGLVIILFGALFMIGKSIPFFSGIGGLKKEFLSRINFLKTFLLGVVFSLTFTPCVGAFLGSALMMAANTNTLWEGILMLSCYCIGLGVPFFISAILIGKLKNTFSFIKKNYDVINKLCGMFLILSGVYIIIR